MLVKLGSVIWQLLFAVGAIRLAFGLYVTFALDDEGERAAAAARYLGSLSAGESIDRGCMLIVAGVAVGLLVKIAKDMDRKT